MPAPFPPHVGSHRNTPVTRAKEELSLSLYDKSGSGERSPRGMCRFLAPKNVRETIEERSPISALSRAPLRSTKYRRREKR